MFIEIDGSDNRKDVVDDRAQPILINVHSIESVLESSGLITIKLMDGTVFWVSAHTDLDDIKQKIGHALNPSPFYFIPGEAKDRTQLPIEIRGVE